MLKKNDYAVYRNDVCKIKDIKDDLYVLKPLYDDSLIIRVSKDTKFIREIVSKKRATEILNEISVIEVLEDQNEKNIEKEYIELLSTGDAYDLIKIIKTAYFRNKKREENNKKLSEKDSKYFSKAKGRLCNEMAIVLNATMDEVGKEIITGLNKVSI